MHILWQKANSRCIALLVLVLVAPFASILVKPGGRVLGDPGGDAPNAYFHYGHFLGQCWREGTVPLWNPHIMLGLPFLGEGQASVFHPLSFLHALLKPEFAINWVVALSFLLTGLFFYGYLRALGLGRPAAWCGAITWSFSSALVSRIFAGHLNILLTFISFPMALMFWERHRKNGGVWSLAGIAMAYALMILAFYPQFLYIFSLFLLFYVLSQSTLSILNRSSTGRREGKEILLLGIFIALGVGVGAIQLFPGIDFVTHSFRQATTIEFCGTLSFAPENLLTLIAPNFFGNTLDSRPGRYWGRNVFWEMWIYIGILPLMLAVVGAWAAPRGRRFALLGGAVIFLIMGLGRHTFLFPIAYEHLPLFDLFRGSSKFTLITLFCLVTLSAYGFEALFGENEELQRRRFRRIATIAGVLLFAFCLVAAVGLLRNVQSPDSNWAHFIRWILASKEVCVPPLTNDGAEFARITSQVALKALMRGLVLIVLSVGLLFINLPARWRKNLFLLPLTLVLCDLLSFFVPLLSTFHTSAVTAPLALDGIEPPVYPPRILIPSNPVPNLAMRSGYSTAFGYTGNTLRRYNTFINRLQNLDVNESRSASHFTRFTPQFSVLGFDAIAFEPEQFPSSGKPIGRLGHRVLASFYETAGEQRRAFLAEGPRYFSQEEDALAYVFSDHPRVWSSPAIERSGEHLTAHPLQKDESVEFISYEPNRVELVVRTKRTRELVLGGMVEKNWKAKINEVPQSVVPANYVFRAVQVPAGTSRVTFYYEPAAFYLGATVTFLSLFILVSILPVRPIRFIFRRKITTRPAITVAEHSGLGAPSG